MVWWILIFVAVIAFHILDAYWSRNLSPLKKALNKLRLACVLSGLALYGFALWNFSAVPFQFSFGFKDLADAQKAIQEQNYYLRAQRHYLFLTMMIVVLSLFQAVYSFAKIVVAELDKTEQKPILGLDPNDD